MKQFLLFLLAGGLSLTAARAERVRLTGLVTDEANEPLVGVTIVEKATQRGTVTDANGRFVFEAAPGVTLVFSFIGYEVKEIVVGNQTTLDVQLVPGAQQLNEVVAVGYQTFRKSDVTGSISSLKAGELNLTTPTLGQSLVGKVAGVQVAQVSGAPYVSTKIRVRGVGSINANSDPLYVIDGYPVTDLFINPNDIESIDILKDAASAAIYGSRAAGGVVLITTKRGKEGKGRFEYDVQYGVNQLAKKVELLNATEFAQLLIDARNNTYRDLMQNAGKPFSGANFSDPNATRIANVGNASAVSIPAEFYDFASQKLIAPTVNTDWQDELYQNALVQRHNLSFSGGTAGTRYAISGGYQGQPGIIRSTRQERINVRANIDGQLNPRLRVAANLAVTHTQNREVREGRFNQGPILGALIYPPFFRAYNDDGSLRKNEAAAQQPLYGYQSIENPVALATEVHIGRRGLRGTYNGSVSYDLLPGWQAKLNLGMQTYSEKYDFYYPTSLSSGANPPGSAQAIAAATVTAQNLTQMDRLAELTTTYTRQFGRHSLNALAGYTAQRFDADQVSVSANGLQNDRIEEITARGADPTNFFLNAGGTFKTTNTLLSYLARVAYNFDERYFLTASIRRDGSSRFGPLNRWGTFPSVSAGWDLSREAFYGDWLGAASTLKLRASWGLSGTNNIAGNYNYLQTMANPSGVVFGTSTINTAAWAGAIKDQRIGWESTSQYNLGLDAGLLNNRLSVLVNYYLSRSFNLLFNQPISAIAGSTSILTNLRDSRVQNQGFDLQLDGRVIATRDLKVNLSGNIGLNRNKVLNMGGANTIFSIGAERTYITHVTQEGQPIGMFYGFRVKGMVRESDLENLAADNAVYNAATQSFPKGYVIKGPPRSTASSNPLRPGDLYFEDVNGDGVVTDADKTVIGSPYPKFIYGLSLTASYRGFDLSSSFNGIYGSQILDGQDYYLFNLEASGNQYSVVADRYRSESESGDGSVYRAARGGTQSNSTRLSSFYLQPGSYFRCTNITLGYTLPAKWLGGGKFLSNARVYVASDNVFTLTKYKGYNPEVDYNNGANLTPGVDYGNYPLARGYYVGAKLTF